MKGTIITCVQGMVEKKHGAAAWAKVLEAAGFPKGSVFVPGGDLPDDKAMKILTSVGPSTGMSMDQVMETFGDYWANDYASKMYAPYFSQAKTAMEFLLGMDSLHQRVTKSTANAHPPQFSYESVTEKSFVMVYHSARGLDGLIPGLVKGVARRYGTTCTVQKVGPAKYKVAFA
ncbi:MAG: heme NO-binding domain-containing protein [Anaeromyxobacter sp.]